MFEKEHNMINCDFDNEERNSHNIYYDTLAAKLVSKLNRHNILIKLISLFTIITEILFLVTLGIAFVFALVVWG